MNIPPTILLSLVFLRNGGAARAALVASCTAVISGLLLVALTLVIFSFDHSHHESLSSLVLERDLRGGLLVAVVLICVAPLTLLQQVLRLGSATREQRLAALRLAGATQSQVRRVGALEVGVPALVGGLLGYLVFRILRLMFGGAVGGSGIISADIAQQLRLVPSSVEPQWWQVLLVAAAVGLLGVAAGWLTSRAVELSPLDVSRRAPRPAPRPWTSLALLVGVPVLVFVTFDERWAAASATAILVSMMLGLLTLASWLAYRVGLAVAARATSVPVLVAARRLATDPRPTGRAAAAIGAIAMLAGGGGVLLADLPNTSSEGLGNVDAFYLVPVALVGVVLLAALLLTVFSMTVHGIESLLDRKRSVASLAALGVDDHELEQIQRWEVGLVAVPVAILGLLIGWLPSQLLLGAGNGLAYAWIPLAVSVATVALVWLSVLVSTRITRPWLTRAASPLNLRTP